MGFPGRLLLGKYSYMASGIDAVAGRSAVGVIRYAEHIVFGRAGRALRVIHGRSDGRRHIVEACTLESIDFLSFIIDFYRHAVRKIKSVVHSSIGDFTDLPPVVCQYNTFAGLTVEKHTKKEGSGGGVPSFMVLKLMITSWLRDAL